MGVQVEPVGQGPLLPIAQGITGGNVCVGRHKPPQGVPVAQNVVGVQIEPVEQAPLLPIVQGLKDCVVGVAAH